MLGKSHALSGGVGWLAGSALAAAAGHAPPAVAVVAGAAVSTGMALLPDLDHPESTVARTLGPLTRILAGAVSIGAASLRSASCRHCLTGRGRGGHRGITHTAVGAVVLGLAVGVLCALTVPSVGLWVVGLSVWLAAHAALSSRTRARIGDMLLPGRFRRLGKGAHRFAAAVGAVLVAVVFVAAIQDRAGSWWWLGLAVFWGCLAHSLGDALTFSAVPLLWPARIRGCRWTPVGTPRWMRFRTGSPAETVVVWLMAAAGAGSVLLLGAVW
ncbi:membrane protein [Actinoplanes philippinensis]|uniref:Membrane-bound metal-dependent hydrolase YbcI, DUF457 family n=1 Tax=Actinoplanes philippinensis TaxID=35752 RepID=A0A1I2G3B2_9ACTN|nr:metal-dependent hydrolase [Actinoplanes philippinensis]GIE76545.1 membrane protein [Actinoplanes philippinensis]SFF11629.1 Membrane-bound metal-dependent hydrolase YbcI, DUF457 family [Actinoplanes philippinensis]